MQGSPLTYGARTAMLAGAAFCLCPAGCWSSWARVDDGAGDGGSDAPWDPPADGLPDDSTDTEADATPDPGVDAIVCGNSVMEAGEQCDDGNSTRFDGCDGCMIVEFMVDDGGDGPADEIYPAVDAAADGRFAVAWGAAFVVMARPYPEQGPASIPAVTVDPEPYDGFPLASLAMRADGGFIVSWSDRFVRINAVGEALGPIIENGCVPTSRSLSMTGEGNWAKVCTFGEMDPYGEGIYMDAYGTGDEPSATSVHVNQYMFGAQIDPASDTGPHGPYIVVWASDGQDGDGDAIIARIHDLGSDGWTDEWVVNDFTIENQWEPDVAFVPGTETYPAERFAVVWTSDRIDGSGPAVSMRLVDVEGTPLSGEIPVNETTFSTQRSASVGASSNGRIVVAWQSMMQDGSSYGVYARIFDAGGSPLTGEIQLHAYTSSDQVHPQVAVLPDGRFIVVWAGDYPDSGTVFAQRFDSSGERRGHLPW